MTPTTAPADWFGDLENADDADDFEAPEVADPDEPETFGDDAVPPPLDSVEADPADVADQRESVTEDDDDYGRAG